MPIVHCLGMPRMGAKRELKWALEAYWRGEADAAALQTCAREIRAAHWRMQAAAGLNFVTVGDFSLYDHVLDMACHVGAIPARFSGEGLDLDTYFRMARGRAKPQDPLATTALEMTKWFDTNYHYLVPELMPGQSFALKGDDLLAQVAEAQALGFTSKVVLLGPLSFLWLAKLKGEGDRLALLEALLPVYAELLGRLGAQGVEWVQMDEPILALDLTALWRQTFESAYHRLSNSPVKLMVAVYFGELADNLLTAVQLPVAGLHVDAVTKPEELKQVVDWLPPHKTLSVGIVDGRNVWRTDLTRALDLLEPVYTRLGERLWLAPSCSLLHVPLDLELETELDAELKSWLAFGRQKLDELALLARALRAGRQSVAEELAAKAQALSSRRSSPRVYDATLRAKVASIQSQDLSRRSAYSVRAREQRAWLKLPLFPTTTIGSFPQTAEIRAVRRAYKDGTIDQSTYEAKMREAIRHAVEVQERLGLDVLVHGEAERNDMVEYFGELLTGFANTEHGWVQSYGSRCVKPPIIYGDVRRPAPMTVEWIKFAQSLTTKPMKGMLTGPITLLKWSFVRDDLPPREVAMQLALALRDEIRDLEAAGIRVIQVDEPAFREALPLRQAQRPQYLAWAVDAFRLATAGVADSTQIHTHMCYSEFNDIIDAIAALDADVITIETARSNMELLDAFASNAYPNEIGPGVYDIHSPNVPSVEAMVELMTRAAELVPHERLWVNPDCGLKTRNWPEVEAALANMVAAAKQLRARSWPEARETPMSASAV